ncbi:hypothetical protein F5B20DRAFT_537639 [Whalleya microplaca]|nr:hypothetical protein F5B20DRAFT_537639 [Whalleya microplaca]
MPNDKLVAISGIAKSYQSVFRSDYVAGLWKSNLCQNLCWYSRNNLERISTYRAPSWSWASVDGGVRYCFFSIYKELVEVVSIYTAPVTRANPHGAIWDSRIQLIGWVFPAFHRGCTSCETQRVGNYKRHRIAPFSWICDTSFSDTLDGVHFTAHIDSKKLERTIALTLLKVPSPEIVECFILPVASEKSGLLYCLLLAAVTPSRSVYQRIGLLQVNFSLPHHQEWAASKYLPKESERGSEELVSCVLSYMIQKYRRCKVPSYEGDILEQHQITLI